MMVVQILFGVAIPALAAFVMFTVAWRPWQRRSPVSKAYVIVPIAFGCAFLLSFLAENGLPIVDTSGGWQWKLDRWEWIAPLVLVTLVTAIFTSMRAGKKWHYAILTCAIGFVVTRWMHLPELDTAKSRYELGLLVVIIISLLNPISERRTGVLFPAVFLIIFATTSVVIMQSGFAKLAIMSGALSAACGMALLVGIFNSNFSIAYGGIMVLEVLSIVIMACGYSYDYSELNILCFILPAVAPLLLWVGEFAFVKKLRPWKATAVRIALVAIPCAIAITLVVAMSAEVNDPYGY